MIHDPYIEKYQGDVLEIVNKCHAIVIMVKHDIYSTLDLESLKAALIYPLIIDGRRVFTREDLESAGFIYRNVGQVFSDPDQ